MTMTMSIEMPDSFSIELRSLLTGLLQRDVPKRLGCRGRGADEIKSHPFFRGIDWRVVYLQRLAPPLIPARGEVNAADAFDIGSFDDEDTKHIKLTEADQELYRNFPVVVSERWQHEIAETIFDYINHEADKAEMKRKNKSKLGYQEEEEQSDCILHGYVKRLGGTFTATWLTRYVRLYPNRLELWSDSGKQPELIFMDQIEEVCNEFVQIKNEQCIVIKLYNHSKYVLTNSDEIGLKEWHLSLKAAHRESMDMMTTMAEKATKIYGTEIPLKHMGKRRQQLQNQQEVAANAANAGAAKWEQKIIQKELQVASVTSNKQPAAPSAATPASTVLAARQLNNNAPELASKANDDDDNDNDDKRHQVVGSGGAHQHQRRHHHHHHHGHHRAASVTKRQASSSTDAPQQEQQQQDAAAATGQPQHKHHRAHYSHRAHHHHHRHHHHHHGHHPVQATASSGSSTTTTTTPAPATTTTGTSSQGANTPSSHTHSHSHARSHPPHHHHHRHHHHSQHAAHRQQASVPARVKAHTQHHSGQYSMDNQLDDRARDASSTRTLRAQLSESEAGKQVAPAEQQRRQVKETAPVEADIAPTQVKEQKETMGRARAKSEDNANDLDLLSSSSDSNTGSSGSTSEPGESGESAASGSSGDGGGGGEESDSSCSSELADVAGASDLAPAPAPGEVLGNELTKLHLTTAEHKVAAAGKQQVVAGQASIVQQATAVDPAQVVVVAGDHEGQERIKLAVSLENVSDQQEVLRDPSKRITSDNKQREQDLVAQYEKLNFCARDSTSSIENDEQLAAIAAATKAKSTVGGGGGQRASVDN